MPEILLYETVQLKTMLSEEDKKTVRSSVNTITDDLDPNIKKPTLMVRLDATHAGKLTGNKTLYEPQWMALNVNTWTDPFQKPVLSHHDKTSDAIGRVKEAVYVDTKENVEGAKGHIQLMAGVTDADAIEKIIDGRYQTVSIGASSTDIRCSICDQNLAEDGLCSHEKGKKYAKVEDGPEEECHWMIGQLTYREISFVNTPADGDAKVTGMELLSPSILNSEDNLEIQYLYDDNKNKSTNMQYTIVEDELEKLDVKYTKLDASTLDGLSQSTFCGPNRSFPVPDKAHAMATLSVLKSSDLDEAEKGRVRASVLSKVKQNGWSLGTSLDEEETELSTKVSLDAEDLKFLENFWVGCSDTVPTEKEDADMFVYAHNLLHSAYDDALGDDGDATDLHQEIHQYIHSHEERLENLNTGALDETLTSKNDENVGDDASSKKDEGESEEVKDILHTYALTDAELEKMEEELSDELKAELDEAKLSTKSRKALPDSAFCGPDRSFPAHDAAHVRNALARLPQAKNFTSAQKATILSCLKGKAKKYGIKISSDAIVDYALHEASLEDILEMDIVEEHIEAIKTGETVTQKQYDELVESKSNLEKSLSETNITLSEAEAKIEQLDQKLQSQESDLDTALDENQEMQKRMHLTLVNKILDKRVELKKPDTQEIINSTDNDEKTALRKKLVEKYAERSAESLRDMISDLDDEIGALGGGKGTIKNPGITNPEDGKGEEEESDKPKTFATREERTLHYLGFDKLDKEN